MSEPTTEAGYKLLDLRIALQHSQSQKIFADGFSAAIAAIEMEAAERERARIRKAVETLDRYHLGTWDETCDLALCGGGGIDRAAVLRIIDKNE